MPTSAWASAGASLMPSPTIATRRPACLQVARSRAPCPRAGPRRARGRCRPARAMAAAVRAIVAGEHDDLEAAAGAARRPPRPRLRLERVGDGDQAQRRGRRRPGRPRSCPRRPAPRRGARARRRRLPRASISVAVAEQHAAVRRQRVRSPARAPSTNSLDRRQRQPALLGARCTIASPIGCSEPCSAAAASASTRRPSLAGRRRTTSVTRGPAHRQRARLVEHHACPTRASAPAPPRCG